MLWWAWLLLGFVLGTINASFWLWWRILRPRVLFRDAMRSDEIAHAIDRARHGKVKEGSADYATLGRLAKTFEVPQRWRR